MQTGTINVQTENIFPIIKKFLYSDQEIFLRELISNAVDATQKIKTLANRGEATGELGELTIEVKLDTENQTLTISDKGLGMTHEEVEKYITQIAFSSAQEFLDKYKDESAIIGHFGLGFYSAFMVADKVEIFTKSYKDAPAVHWTCDGTTEYTIAESDKTDRGTDIVLHLNEEAAEYKKEAKISELLKKYCRFLPVEIKFGESEQTIPAEEEGGEEQKFMVDNIINNPNPLWKKTPTDLTDEDYIAFYKELHPYSGDPLFWIHLNVDHPFQLTGILYFPKMNNTFEVKKDRIHLYSNQVFVTDHVDQIVPDWLMLLHGMIDSPDIPLNVSRSYLQSDPEVKKINKYITRKVADKLGDLFFDDRKKFEEKWGDISILIKYGMLSDEKFEDKARKFCLLENTEGEFFTFDEYQEKVKDTQTDKDNKINFLYAQNLVEQHSFVEAAKAKGYDILKLDAILDAHFINQNEQKNPDVKWKRVDSESIDKLIEKDEAIESILNKEQEEAVEGVFKNLVGSEQATIVLKPLTPNDAPVTIVKPEFMRRMQDMSALSDMGMGKMPEFFQVVINANHPTVSKILNETDETAQSDFAKQLYDLARLQQNMLKGAELTNFINRSVAMVGK